VAEKSESCDVLVLAPGKTPDRPYRDVGVVELQHCPDYEESPCRKWLIKAACSLGGDVAYFAEPVRPEYEYNAITYRVTVAAYVALLRQEELRQEELRQEEPQKASDKPAGCAREVDTEEKEPPVQERCMD